MTVGVLQEMQIHSVWLVQLSFGKKIKSPIWAAQSIMLIDRVFVSDVTLFFIRSLETLLESEN